MNLVKTGALAIVWYLRMLRHQLRAQTGRTLSLIVATLIVRVTSMLAFMIPLKVLLLAGSDGVPRYMPFVDPAHREFWIVGLALGAVSCYLLTLLFEKLIATISIDGGRSVLKAANDLIVINAQQKQAHNTFARIGQIASDALFTLAAAAVIFLLEPVLFAWLAGLLLLGVLVSAVALAGHRMTSSNRLARFIVDERSDYLDIWASVAFLSSSVALLGLLYYGQTNLLLAIISFILTRRALSTLSSTVDGLCGLYERRVAIEAILYRSRNWLPQESGNARNVRQVFARDKRRSLMRRQLGSIVELAGDPVVEWLDPLAPQIDRFAVTAPLLDGGEAHFLVHVVASRGMYLVENEALLFDHVARARLGMPELKAQFEIGDFTCLVFSLESSVQPSKGESGAARLDHAVQRWSVQPSKRLVNAYRASHRLLHDFLDDDLLERLAFAAKDAKDLRSVEHARELQGRIRDRLAAMPLVIAASKTGRDSILRGADGNVVAPYWGGWSLMPIGSDMPLKISAAAFADVLETLRAHRKDIPPDLSLADLNFAQQCQKLHAAVSRRRYREGLAKLKRLLRHPVLQADASEAEASDTVDAVEHAPKLAVSHS